MAQLRSALGPEWRWAKCEDVEAVEGLSAKQAAKIHSQIVSAGWSVTVLPDSSEAGGPPVLASKLDAPKPPKKKLAEAADGDAEGEADGDAEGGAARPKKKARASKVGQYLGKRVRVVAGSNEGTEADVAAGKQGYLQLTSSDGRSFNVRCSQVELLEEASPKTAPKKAAKSAL